ncbi:hypothetical protein [Nonomuraea sp. NPDC050783]|uniref:hypothetical protein n=1 Tax=Nonomuraea sp. NPDC050783 TaxID=3154634 RepID=UPI0034675BD0
MAAVNDDWHECEIDTPSSTSLRVLAAVLHLRLRPDVKAFSALIDTSRGTIYRALDEIRPLQIQHHTRIGSIDTESVLLTDLLSLAQTTAAPDQSA